MRDVEKRLLRLEARLQSRRARIVTLTVNHGEDAELIAERWRHEHPNEAEPDGFVLMTVFSAPPRLGLASHASVLEVLPHVKAFAGQCDDVDVEAWRGWAQAAGIDWDAVIPERPLEHGVGRHD